MDERQRIQELNWKINQNKASEAEKLEYIELLYKHNRISEEQYTNYKKGINRDAIIKSAMVIGGLLLGAWLLSELLKSK